MSKSVENDNSVFSGFERVNLQVKAGTAEKMTELAGSRQRMGQWLSDLVENMYEAKKTAATVQSMDLEGLRLMCLGLGGQVQAMKGEIAHLQSQLAAIIAKVG